MHTDIVVGPYETTYGTPLLVYEVLKVHSIDCVHHFNAISDDRGVWVFFEVYNPPKVTRKEHPKRVSLKILNNKRSFDYIKSLIHFFN